MEKTKKISFKIYPNDRIGKVSIAGGKETPLYIRVVHNRYPRYFKSPYFDLLSEKRYRSTTGKMGKSIMEQIEKKEKALFEFMMERQRNNYDFDAFKAKYLYYATDLLSKMEPLLFSFLSTFFEDRGQPSLSAILREGYRSEIGESVLTDLQSTLKPPIYARLAENAVHYAPPSIPVYAFCRQREPAAAPLFSVMDWENEDTREELLDFVKNHYPDYSHSLEVYMEELINCL
ncbi:hypothetical protein LAG90_18630 [Marinilongibacter aquaticus]|uniref:hypothetical protein n=1 Tax=Marinilongibacter aquaticus TaxID=2975157 RepID=UPI0021BD6A84|nr:hypothetical protein [Marinilongibacter aquaticus]UBM58817.1 hypothetical protein LAG90_18630 [Marinilongibacter aquaticus]